MIHKYSLMLTALTAPFAKRFGFIKLPVFFLFLLVSAVGWGQINYVAWDFTTNISNANYATNMTNQQSVRTSELDDATISNISLNGTVFGTNANTFHRTGASGWSATLDDTKYLEFTIFLDEGTFKDENLELTYTASVNNNTTARRTVQARYAWGNSPVTFTNAGAALTGIGTVESSRTAVIVAPGNTTTTRLTVRLYNYDNNCGGSCTGNIQFRTINIEGPELDVPTTPPSVVLASSNPASTEGNLVQGTTNNVIYGFNLAATDANAALTGVTFTTVGGYASSEVSNYKLWYSADATFSAASDTNIATLTASDAGSKNFTSFTQNIAVNTTRYFFITTDIPCTANTETSPTLRVNAITTAGLTFGNASTEKSGTAYQGATHTFTSATASNASSFTTANCQNGGTNLNWINTTTCFDEVYVFAKASAFTAAVPTGNGSLYPTASTTFGSGTGFDGGFLVYKGTLAAVSNISNLTNGTQYHFKIFTRNDNNWSSGITTSCTPTVAYCIPTATTNDATGLTYVGFNTIVQTSVSTPEYTDYYDTVSTTVEAGSTVPLNVRVNTAGTYTVYANAWIDWDNDGDFTDETTINLGIAYSVTDGATDASPQNVIIPNSPGTYRMRVRATYNNAATSCDSQNYSEAEDYKIIVIAASGSTLTATQNTLSGFTYEIGDGPSGSQSFILSGNNLDGTENVDLLPGDNWEISIDNQVTWIDYINGPATITNYDGSNQTVYVRLKEGLPIGIYNNASNDIILIDGYGTDTEVTLSGEVTPIITAKTYTLVTSIAGLEPDAKYLISNRNTAGSGYALGSQSVNFRERSAITVASSQITTDVATLSSDTLPFEITLGGSTGAWTLYDSVNSTYLRPATGTSGNNYLSGNTEPSAYTITFSSDAAVMTNIGHPNTNGTGRNVIRYNGTNGSERFSSYLVGSGSPIVPVYLYKENPPSISPSDYFRSKNTGPANWNNASSWQFSRDGVNWYASTLVPTDAAKTITIRAGHTIQVNTAVNLDETVVAGTLQILTDGDLYINDGTGHDLTIVPTGVLNINHTGGDYSNIFYPDVAASIHIQTGGRITVSDAGGNPPGNLHNLATNANNVWETGAIYEWNHPNGTPIVNNVIYFPNADAITIPVFRISDTEPSTALGGGNPATINGITEINTNLSFTGNGVKNFRNGLSGTATVTFPSSMGGTLNITSTTSENAFLLGSLTLVLQRPLTLTSGVTVPTGSHIVIDNASTSNIAKGTNGIFMVEIGATFNIGERQISNTSGSVNIDGTFITSHPNGFSGTGSSLPTSGGVINLGPNNTIELNRLGDQHLTALAGFRNLVFSGSGTKTTSTAIALGGAGSITVRNNAVLNVGNSTTGGSSTTLTLQDNAQYINSGGGVKPDAGGAYTLGSNTTIEFTGVAATQIRVAPNYTNLVVSGTNVTAGSTESVAAGLTFQTGGTFRVTPTGVFKVNNPDGFIGTANAAIKSTSPQPTITLETGSTIEYNFAGDQPISYLGALPAAAQYKNLTLSGSGNKTLGHPTDIVVNQNLTVTGNAALPVTGNQVITVVDAVNVTVDDPDNLNTGFNILDNGQLIQVTDVAANNNTGNIRLSRTANIRRTDYVYWSSPVEDFLIQNVSPNTPNGYKFEWIPTKDQGFGGPPPMPAIMDFGDWEAYNTGSMNEGKGYIVRGSNNIPDDGNAHNSTATFVGKPNNGIIAQDIFWGAYDGVGYTYNPYGVELNVTKADDNWNLLGNPYPSALNAEAFLLDNTNIEGAVHIWTHGTQISDDDDDDIDNTFYESFTYNYNPEDYITYNATAPTTYPAETFPGDIASGQGFFVMANHSATAGSAEVRFNNTMRGKTLDNSVFYRQASQDGNPVEKHRIWLSLIAPGNKNTTTVVGYVEGATLEKDRMYDAMTMEANALTIFSLIDQDRMTIQGRPVPFDTDDRVPLGIIAPNTGIYTIAIKGVDGLFLDESQNIYLEDTYTNVIHDIKGAPYLFTVSEPATLEDRFILRYTTGTLDIDNPSFNSGITIIAFNNDVKVTSGSNTINTIEVYDILGRAIAGYKNVNTTTFTFNLNANAGTYIVKATLHNGTSKVQKIIQK